MSEKRGGKKLEEKPSKRSLKKMGIAAAVGALFGLGVEVGAERIKSIDKVDQNTSAIKAEENSPVLESTVGSQASMPVQDSQFTEFRHKQEAQRKLKELEQAKKVINRIYSEEPDIETTKESISDRYSKLRESLNERIGDQFDIEELVSPIDEETGIQRHHFNIVPVESDGKRGKLIRVNYEDDGTLTVDDEGLTRYIGINPDEQLVDNLVGHVQRVRRMREEASKFESGELTEEDYRRFLIEEMLYNEMQAQLIIDSKTKTLNDILRGADETNKDIVEPGDK